jgi:MYXO-CTERM domain-containing protein
MPAGDQADMHKVAFRIYSALGFGWGLENLGVSGQIMGGYSGVALHFGNSCQPISGTQNCIGAHVGCPDGQQNSTADLLARIGPRVDDGPPFVTITEPMPLQIVPSDFSVGASVGDLYGGLSVELELVEAGQIVPDDFPPYGWNLNGVPDGTWTLRVTATDADANVVSSEVVVCIGTDECDGAPGGTGTTGGSTSGGDTTGDVGDGTTTVVFETSGPSDPDPPPPDATTGPPPPDPTSFGMQDAETGCQCRADAGTPTSPAAWLWALFALGLARRRRLG